MIRPLALRGTNTDGSAGRGIEVWPPVVLAPMAGVTNAPFRSLCRKFGPGLVYVNEMIMAAALVYGNTRTRSMVTFAPDETFRSLQLYGSDPRIMESAVDGDTEMTVPECSRPKGEKHPAASVPGLAVSVCSHHESRLATSTREVCDVFDAAGFDCILIETVGVGQSELDVARKRLLIPASWQVVLMLALCITTPIMRSCAMAICC